MPESPHHDPIESPQNPDLGVWEIADKAHATTSHLDEFQAQLAEITAKLDTEEFQELAQTKKESLIQAGIEKGNETHAWMQELISDLKALDKIEEAFKGLPNFDQFKTFISVKDGTGLSHDEREAFLDAVKNRASSRRLIPAMEEGLPTNRIQFSVIADKFGIPTSQADDQKIKENIEIVKINYRTKLQSIHHIDDPSISELKWKISDLLSSENQEEVDKKITEINLYLVWPSEKGGEIDNILTSLREKDAENAAKWVATTHFEDFAQTARDFSPAVSKRVSAYMDENHDIPVVDTKGLGTPAEAIIASGLPKWTTLSADSSGTYVWKLSDGGSVMVHQDGDLITRSIDYEGVNYPLETPLEQADLSSVIAERDGIKMEYMPKQQACERALSYLENPLNKDVPLEDMKEGLLAILGYELFNELGVRESTDKTGLISKINTNVGVYKSKLDKAQRKFEKEAKASVKKARERNEKNDESRRLTLKTIKNSALGKLWMDWLAADITWEIIHPQIGGSFDIGNFDPANNNFWEPTGKTNSQTEHLEYIYRIANKIISGNPEEPFNLDPTLLKTGSPQAIADTDSAIVMLLTDSWVMGTSGMVNKEEVRKRLNTPIENQSG